MKAVCTIFFLILCSAAFAQEAPVKLKVETTLFPVYDMARIIGGERVDVSLLMPPGVEPHSYEPTPRDIVRISDSDIFIYTGALMEPWVEKILPGITNQNLLIVEASQGLLIKEKDPHVWLDFGNDKKIADTISDAFCAKDPDHRPEYLERADNYKAALASLDERYRQGLKSCQSRTVLYAGHFAFGYMAARYGLEQLSPYTGFSPDAEPSPRAVAELINNMKASSAKTIYYEELIDPKVARLISEETGAQMVLLDAAHNISADEKSAGVSFISIMEDDLVKLKAGLVCP